MLAALLTLLLPPPQNDLYQYLARPEPLYRFELKREEHDREELTMTSQRWMGHRWDHELILVRARERADTDTAILVITGDRADNRDLPQAERLAELSGLPVAMLFNVPNQPLFDKREDALIAHTFERYLLTEDSEWPLLFPMVKSAVQAMRTIEEHTNGRIKRFVVAGASKRGWTTWLVGGARDSRVIGIAPMVFDMLNFDAQLPHQLKSWGNYSFMISDYTERGLAEALTSEPGRKLAQLVDPYHYLDAIKAPVLAIHGTNDPYWTVDAHRLYWDNVPEPKLLLNIPNAGHGLEDGEMAMASLAAFARQRARAEEPVRVGWYWKDNTLVVPAARGRHLETRFWVASAPRQDFRQSEWKQVRTERGTASFRLTPSEDYQAVVAHLVFDGEPRMTVSTAVYILPPKP
jgi:PhoPQ-activated pathogenicity-related protein